MKKRGYEASYVHHTKLKEAIIARFPGIREETDGKSILFVFPESMKNIMKATSIDTEESDSWIIAKAAAIIQREIEEGLLRNFNGEFQDNCQENTIPQTLSFFHRT